MSELELRVQRRARVYRLLLVALAVLVAATLAACLLVLVLQNERLAQFATQNQADSNLLVECTTPPESRTPPVKVSDLSSDCYTRAQQSTGQVVEDISTISIAAAACGAANPGDVKATELCVKRTLAARR